MCQQTSFDFEPQQQFEFEVNWDEPEELDESWKEAWQDHARQICSMPHYEIDPISGDSIIAYFHPCNQYAKCAICAARKKVKELRRLEKIKKECENAKYVKTTDEEAKKLVRKYGKEKVRRIAFDDGSTGVIVDTEDDIGGEELTDDIIKSLAENVITKEDGRRASGNLGKEDKTTSIDSYLNEPEEKPKEKKEIEIDWDTPGDLDDPVKVVCRKMIIDFNSIHPLAPRTDRQLQYMAWSEVDIYRTPITKEELREGVKKLENKRQEICQRYGMSFRFYSNSLNEVNLYECDWKWTKNKLKIE